ncbi:MAG: peptide chain release factor N(5)-glutamine methyltransferase [Acidobacteria bacterium]|nr:peptide chain release factor N(5)-glutamine methyltransferase [Acidobacteriota bacterium]
MAPHTIAELTRAGKEILAAASVEEPRRTAGLLLQFALKVDPLFVLIHPTHAVALEAALSYFHLLERRASGEPVQYITGRQEFYGLDLEVTPHVLVPRPETELIVDAVQELNRQPTPTIIDVGTGSGCIAVALASRIPASRVFAVDISAEALNVARGNALRHGVEDRIHFVHGDLFKAFDGWAEPPKADFIASNPPYVSTDELETLPREVREHEPHLALIAGDNADSVHRRLLCQGERYLRAGGFMICEMGAGQYPGILELVEAGVYSLLQVKEDLQGIPRILVLERLP